VSGIDGTPSSLGVTVMVTLSLSTWPYASSTLSVKVSMPLHPGLGV
jgi:hypothetical protein